MRHLLTLIIYFSILIPIVAQPTITSDWFHEVGDTLKTHYYYPEQLEVPNEGIDISWDISNAQVPYGERDIIWVVASDLVHSSDFPNATLGYKQSMGREFYYKIEGGQFKRIGSRSANYKNFYEAGNPTEGFNNFSFGDTETISYSRLNVNLQTMDTTLMEEVDVFTYAGYGTVITPEGTYENCIMTKQIRTTNSLDYFIQYKFHKDNLSNHIASYRIYTGGNVEPARSVEYKREQTSSSTNELSNEILKVSGPFQNIIHLNSQNEMDAQISIIDVAGRTIYNETMQIHLGTNHFEIPKLPESNIYILLVVDNKTGNFKAFKFKD